MNIYRLEYEMADGISDVIESIDDNELLAEFSDLKNDDECTYAKLTELFVYGGICQGENIIDEYTKE